MEKLTRGELLLQIDSCRSKIDGLRQQAASRGEDAGHWHLIMRAEYEELLVRLLSRLEETQDESQPLTPRSRGTGESPPHSA
jgi:hypothetical protein